ncbi:MAG: hypothetical protein QY325_06385 [Flavobacteriales bacterium]|nr:MAG: hypothetical protein QY325_06385 [Flavobacteriales bacterium]
MSAATNTSSKADPDLRGTDRWLFGFGIGFLSLSVGALLLLGFVFISDYGSDFLTFDGVLAAAGAVLGSVATTFAAIGSALLFIVSLRVQARELQNSIFEMRNSVAAQRQTADNHKQALTIAQQELLVAKQEKEFNVISTVIGEVNVHVASITVQTNTVGSNHSGFEAISTSIEQWTKALDEKNFSHGREGATRILLSGENPDSVLVNYR